MIETTLERIAVALEQLVAAKMSTTQPGPAATLAAAALSPQAAQAPQFQPQGPPPQAAQAAQQFTPPAQNPAPFPQGTQPLGQPQGGTCPFNDQAGCTEYVMNAYQELGQVKGARIQECLAAVGAGNINEVQPQAYQQFWEAVEAVKTSA